MTRLITLIPGDGIGPEGADAAVRVVEAAGAEVEWERVEAGARALAEQGQLVPGDVGGSASTGQFTEAVMRRMR